MVVEAAVMQGKFACGGGLAPVQLRSLLAQVTHTPYRVQPTVFVFRISYTRARVHWSVLFESKFDSSLIILFALSEALP